MIRSLYTSRSALVSKMQKMDVISGNLENTETIGYKRSEMNFENLFQETLERKGYPLSSNTEGIKQRYTGTGVKSASSKREDSQGTLMQTNIVTDLAIDGEGYFKIIMPDGTEAYTRTAAFKIDSEGKLVNDSGARLVVLNNNGKNVNAKNSDTKFTETNFQIDYKGYINHSDEELRIAVYNAVGLEGMESKGQNVYKPKKIFDKFQGEKTVDVFEVKDSNVVQGFLETSNVDFSKEMSDMIVTQRSFEMSSKAFNTADEMWQMANDLKGR